MFPYLHQTPSKMTTPVKLPLNSSLRTPSPQHTKLDQNSHNRSILESCDTTFDESLLSHSKGVHSPLQPCVESFADSCDRASINSMEALEDSHTIMNSALNQRRKATTDESKYKTELCKKWMETRQCPYGKKCKFAHGKEELNERAISNKNRYKSKKCSSFHSTMVCRYGIRCLFVHGEKELNTLKEENYYEKFMAYPELLDDRVCRRGLRLPVFLREAEERNGSISVGQIRK